MYHQNVQFQAVPLEPFDRSAPTETVITAPPVLPPKYFLPKKVTLIVAMLFVNIFWIPGFLYIEYFKKLYSELINEKYDPNEPHLHISLEVITINLIVGCLPNVVFVVAIARNSLCFATAYVVLGINGIIFLILNINGVSRDFDAFDLWIATLAVILVTFLSILFLIDLYRLCT